MKGKYLITTDEWFTAPDGNNYKAVWGDVKIMEDSFLGLKTNRNSTNWYILIGNDEHHVIVAGCQIHYAIKTIQEPSTEGSLDWNLDASSYKEQKTPNKIYIVK